MGTPPAEARVVIASVTRMVLGLFALSCAATAFAFECEPVKALPVTVSLEQRLRVCSLIGVWQSMSAESGRQGFSPQTESWVHDTVSAVRAGISDLDRLNCASLDPSVLAAAILRFGTKLKTLDPALLSGDEELIGYARDANTISWKSLKPRHFESFNSIGDSADELSEFVGGAWLWFLKKPDRRWAASVRDGSYHLEHSGDKRAVKYIYVYEKCDDMAGRPVSVEVKLDDASESPMAGAGLLLGFDELTKTYLALTLSRGQRVNLLSRNKNGFKVLFSERSDLVDEKNFNKIAVTISGDYVFLYVRDQLVRTYGPFDVPRGRSGIIAISDGRFSYDNFTIYW